MTAERQTDAAASSFLLGFCRNGRSLGKSLCSHSVGNKLVETMTTQSTFWERLRRIALPQSVREHHIWLNGYNQGWIDCAAADTKTRSRSAHIGRTAIAVVLLAIAAFATWEGACFASLMFCFFSGVTFAEEFMWLHRGPPGVSI
jgi:hypothetical protein